jgi:Holliday junction resolvase
MRRIPAKRDQAEADIVRALRAAGCTVYFVMGKDVPDLVLGIRGRTILAEVKTGKKHLRPGQAEFHQTWRGGPLVILRSVDEALALVRT